MDKPEQRDGSVWKGTLRMVKKQKIGVVVCFVDDGGYQYTKVCMCKDCYEIRASERESRRARRDVALLACITLELGYQNRINGFSCCTISRLYS